MEWVKRLFRQHQQEEIPEQSSFEEVPVKKQPPFRFPLISDDEKNYLVNKPTAAPFEPTPSSYSYENHYTPSEPQAPKKPYAPSEPRTPKRKQDPVSNKPVQKEIVRSKKRYVPSVVPSPVFGLKTEQESAASITRTMRTSHYDWTAEQQEELPVQAVELDIPTKVEALRTEPVVVDKMKDEIPAPQEQVVEQSVNLNNEEATATIEQVALEQAENVVEETVPEPERPKEKIKPFNVLMLSSDKRKLEQKVSVPTQLKQEPIQVPAQPAVPLDETRDMKSEVKEEPIVPNYAMPASNFLHAPVHKSDDNEWMDQQAEHLVEALAHFQIQSEVISIVQGPAVTQFELTVGQGTKVSKIRNLTDDLKLALAAKDIRIQAPIPGRRSIGIEIPNRVSRAVQISEVIEAPAFKNADSPLEVAMGLDLHGQPVTMDLRKMPHGLIAGATGSGKSVFINSLLISLLYKASPSDVKLLLIDPKVVELAPFNHIPHLISPVITDVKAAAAALKWAVEEMERRYQLFAHAAVRDISRFNQNAIEAREFSKKLPYIVIVIDELADMMMAAPQDVEDSICRIAQKARACGIHLVLATQRPSVDVITGLIKSNVPTRIAFSVSSQIDSRTILDQQGAERLLGKGDMLYLGSGMASPIRIQGTYVSDDEIDRIIAHARSQGEPDYIFKQEDLIVRAVEVEEQDELFEEACRFIIEHGAASTSLLQRKFHLGYNRAARLMDAMETAGIITGQNGSKPREVLVSEEFLQEIL